MRLHRAITVIISVICMGATPAVCQPVEPGAEGKLAALLSPEPGNHICYSREYDAAHMKAHPQQKVRSMSFRLAYFRHEPDSYSPEGQRNYYFELHTTMHPDGRPLVTGGECAPTDVGNKIRCGVDCDGGGIMIRKGAKQGQLIIDLEATGRIRMSDGCDDEEGVDLEPGIDDKVFLLSQVPADSCLPYDDW